MIDWLTLRLPITAHFRDGMLDQLAYFLSTFTVHNSDGEEVRKKLVFDVDKLRSDSQGIYWSITHDGKQRFLTIGASPAHLEHGHNVFGSGDIRHCAEVLILAASRMLGLFLPPPIAWHCTRIDYTFNYALRDHHQVKQALRELRKGDGIRQKAAVPKGDSVYWGQGSDLISGKAYDKGAQMIYLSKRNKLQATPEQISLASRLLRLELSLKARWFRRHYSEAGDFLQITQDQLTQSHSKFFGQFIGDIEVATMDKLLTRLEFIAPSRGHALAAYSTWLRIREMGFEMAKASMPDSTFRRHKKYLLEAGLSQADLLGNNIIPIRRDVIRLAAPVLSWDDLRHAA
jgi:II/X family phage/plasmid replication protein